MNPGKCSKLILLSFIIFLLGFIAGISLPVGYSSDNLTLWRDGNFSLNDEDIYFFLSNNFPVAFMALLGLVTLGMTSLTNLILNGIS